MKIYIRKIDAQCLTHQISVPKDIILTFFDNAKDKEKFIFVGKHSNFKGEVSILLSTDPRLGGDIKQVINAEGGMDVDDLLVIYKDKTYYTLEVLKNSNTEYRYFYELIDGSKDRHILLVSDDKTDNNIKTNIEDLIKEEYSKLDFSEMENEIEGLYKNFYISFSPEALMLIDDQDLPRYMFYSENYNNTNMCWNLEFNPKMRKYFGAIGGGSAYLYGLHYSQKHKTWMTGTNMNPIKLTYSEAINKAKDIRQKLCDAVEIVKKYKGTSNIDDYTKMYSELLESCGDIINKVWVKKYLHMMFPDMFITFYTWNWLSFLNKKCGFELHDNTFELSGELALLSRRVNLPCAIVGKVLFSLFGYYNNDNEEKNDNHTFEILERDPRRVKIHGMNTILYGAPGTGKTYATTEYAVAIIENRHIRNNISKTERDELKKKYRALVNNGQIVFTTFHQNYGYEDFIQSLRPEPVDGNIEFNYKNGIFKDIAERAKIDKDNNYVIIIDEINRGNISKIFGELITLIEEDKRWGEENQLSITLPSKDEFVVPNNLYILGTMNSADKSIALIDTALRRRFEFIEIAPNADLINDPTLKKVLIQINSILKKQLDSSDLLIGHAYFIGKTKDDLVNILNRNIIPLLYEYFYDNERKVKDVLLKALENTNVQIQENTNGRLKVQ